MKQIILLLSVLLFPAGIFAQQAQIKARAAEKWPGDYKMQAYQIKKETDAYEFMRSAVDQELVDMAQKKWPENYSMQKYEYERQWDAKRELSPPFTSPSQSLLTTKKESNELIKAFRSGYVLGRFREMSSEDKEMYKSIYGEDNQAIYEEMHRRDEVLIKAYKSNDGK